jgi:glucosamine--fructose-6-phosphate aminotransferase (isomerizing)
MDNGVSDPDKTIMMSEISEEPVAISKTFEALAINFTEIIETINNSEIVYITGSGTSYHASINLQITLLRHGIKAVAVMASQLEYYLPINRTSRITIILFSQSGESKDVLKSLELSKARGYNTIGITNIKDSTLAKSVDIPIITMANEEKSVAATKSHIVQILISIMIDAKLRNNENIENIKKIRENVSNIISNRDKIKKIAGGISDRIVLLGDGYLYPSAMEGALKFKETGNLITESYPSREYLHGPIQALNRDTTVILLNYDNNIDKEVINKIGKITEKVISIGNSNSNDLIVPNTTDVIAPLLFLIPLQIMANYKAVNLHLNPDSPSHLTKIVQ